MLCSLLLECFAKTDGSAFVRQVAEAHFLESFPTVEFVMRFVRLLSKILHVGADQHLAKFHEIAMVLIFD